jgi:N-acetylmuramate 1-kinase
MLNYTCTADEELMLQRFFDDLIESALAQPQVFVHRDYHSRNIMITADDQLATIDFQDAVCGPITYDLVSLLRDCYVVWPDAQVRGWVKHYWQQLHAGHIIDVQESVFQRWFDLMGLQRHIKVLGIFARLSIRDGKHGYLNDLPTVVNYVRSVAADEFIAEDFLSWFDKKSCHSSNSKSGVGASESHDSGCRFWQTHATAHSHNT